MGTIVSGFAEQVLRPTRDVIGAHLQVRDRWNAAEELASMTRHAVHDYGGRFLLELIQNGYDAHPDDAVDGQMSIVLDDGEGEFGTLYVANAGAPFVSSNYLAIRRLGMSDKAPGESIGHKGVGFKSVLQVSERPEVYSADPSRPFGGRLDGFCFGPAEPSDLETLLGLDADVAKLVWTELPRFALTVPRVHVPPTAAELAADGHVTVVRLALRSATARSQAWQALTELRDSDVPVLLFLPQLRRLVFEHRDRDGETVRRELTRLATPVTAASDQTISTEIIDLGDRGRFLVANRTVPVERLAAAIEAGVGDEELEPTWREWSKPAVVSVAVPLEHEATDFRTYAFLPLGRRARSPFAGHMNAPFRTFLNRTDLSEDEHLNRLFIDVAAETCLLTIDALTHCDLPGARAAAVDLACWSTDHLQALEDACQRLFSQPLATRLKLPVQTASGAAWASPVQARRWPAGTWQVLSRSAALPLIGVPLLDDDLQDRRVKRLDKLVAALNLSLAPKADQLAVWVEQMLRVMPVGDDLSGWDLAYDELATMFDRDPDALQGRRVLLDESNRLRRCNVAPDSSRRRPRVSSAFFPAVRGRVEGEDDIAADADLRIPAELVDRMFYLHPGLRWTTNSRPAQQTRARRWLERHRLVRRFDARSLLDHVRDALRRDTDDELALAALGFAFRVHLARPGSQLSLEEVGLKVPILGGGWLPAGQALFSSAWPRTAGGQIETLIREATGVSDDLTRMQARLLARPADVTSADDDISDWVAFLRRAGVRDWLDPVAMPSTGKSLYGAELTHRPLAAFMGLTEEAQQLWRAHFDRLERPARYPQTPYVAATPGYGLPGQDDHEHLSSKAKSAYAELLVLGLDKWSDECLRTSFHRDRSGDPDVKTVPTLAAAFLVRAAWLETRAPGHSGGQFVQPADAWMTNDEDDDNARRFAPLVSMPLRRLIFGSKQTLQRLRHAGIGVWSDPDHAGRLIWHHGQLLADTLVPDLESGTFRRSYQAAWARLTGSSNAGLPAAPTPRYLVVEQRERLTVVPVDEPGSVYVTDNAAASSYRIARELGLSLLPLREHSDTAARLLAEDTALEVRAVAAAAASVILDGHTYTPASASPALVDDLLPWLPTLIGLAIEYRTTFLRLAETGFRGTIDRLRRLRVVNATEITVTVDRNEFTIPDRMHDAFAIPDPTWPTLVLRQQTTNLDAAELRRAAGAICELIGRPQLVEALRLSIMELDELGADFADGPDNDELATVFGITAEQVGDTRRRVNRQITTILHRLYPIVVHLCGPDAAAGLDPGNSMISDEHMLATALRRLPLGDGLTADTLLREAIDAQTVYSLRDRLGIDFAQFNHVLHALSPAYAPDLPREQHGDAFKYFVAQQRREIIDRLRTARLADFDEGRPQSDWRELRALAGLESDEAWLMLYRLPSEELMRTQVETWLARHGTSDHADAHLPALESVQQANRTFIVARLPVATATVRAWAQTYDRAVPTWWVHRDQPETTAAAVDELDRAAALDFRCLDDSLLINWLTVLGHWPADMPPSLDTDALGVRPEDVNAAAAGQARLERARQRRVIQLDDQDIDVGGNDFEYLCEALRAKVGDQDPFPGRSTRFATPTLPARNPRSSTSGAGYTGGGRTPSANAMSDDQRQAVGFIGEWLAYQWLQHRYPTASPECWVSTYRRHVFPGVPGDDGLGFDFRIPAAKDLYFEVKTTQGELGEFELGESQVREAQRHTHEDRWRLIVISNALDTSLRRLEVLPNPFSRRGQQRFQLVGRGLRFRYALPNV